MLHRRGRLAASLGVLVMMGLRIPARAANPDVRQALEANYARISQTSQANDKGAAIQLMRDLTTDDFQFVPSGSSRRVITREAMLKGLEKAPWEPNSAYDNRLIRLTVRGDTARAIVELHTAHPVRDPKITGDSSGQPHQLANDLRMRDTWVKTGAGWKLRRTVVFRERVTLDGKPLPRSSPKAHGKMRNR